MMMVHRCGRTSLARSGRSAPSTGHGERSEAIQRSVRRPRLFRYARHDGSIVSRAVGSSGQAFGWRDRRRCVIYADNATTARLANCMTGAMSGCAFSHRISTGAVTIAKPRVAVLATRAARASSARVLRLTGTISVLCGGSNHCRSYGVSKPAGRLLRRGASAATGADVAGFYVSARDHGWRRRAITRRAAPSPRSHPPRRAP